MTFKISEDYLNESKYIQQCAVEVVEITAGRKSVEGSRKQLWLWFKSHGIDVSGKDPDGIEPGCVKRDQMELSIPVMCFQNCARWVRSRAAWRAYPICELIFTFSEDKLEEFIRDRWRRASAKYGDVISGQRMIARKDHKIWEEFGDFGRPWGPYFWEEILNGKVGLMARSISRSEAISLGIWRPGMVIEPEMKGIQKEHGMSEFLAMAWRNDPEFSLVPELPPVVIRWRDEVVKQRKE